MSLLIPVFLAGGLLVAGPWLIHRIRRPEREEVRFSSLMFVPKVKKDVIEPRKIQHILLMLLRMALLALLALAFSRPYWPISQTALAAEEAGAVHLIMVDVSLSMGEGMAAAKEKARNALAAIPAGEAVGLAVFAAEPSVLVPISAGAGVRERVRTAIAQLSAGAESAAYAPALRFGETQLLAGGGDPDIRRTLHMVSDFQRSGMPAEDAGGWRLSGQIAFEGYPAPNQALRENLSVDGVHVHFPGSNQLTVAARIKNWSRWEDRQVQVALFIDDVPVAERTATISAANATRVAFTLPELPFMATKGYVAVTGDDSFPADNRRYFSWRPPRKRRLAVIADPPPEDRVWSAASFITRALRPDDSFPWTLIAATQAEAPQLLADPARAPDVAVFCDLDGFRPQTGQAIESFVRAGGSALLTLNERMTSDTLNANLLEALALRDQGLRYQRTAANQFASLARLNFDHPVFFPFKGSRYNDFSQLRFYNYRRLTPTQNDAKTLAWFGGRADAETAPAMLEAPLGEGRLAIWCFTPDLEWTNLPQTIKFLPILRETAIHLAGLDPPPPDLLVGDRPDLTALLGSADWAARTPAGDALPADGNGETRLARAGFLALKPVDAANWTRYEPVNLDPRESDSEIASLDEVVLRLTSSRVTPAETAPPGSRPDDAAYEHKREFGRTFLAALFVLLLFETWYAIALSAKRAATAQT